jgi:hypothetical protein
MLSGFFSRRSVMGAVPVSAWLDLAEVMVAVGRDDGTVFPNQHMNAVSLGQVDAVLAKRCTSLWPTIRYDRPREWMVRP